MFSRPWQVSVPKKLSVARRVQGHRITDPLAHPQRRLLRAPQEHLSVYEERRRVLRAVPETGSTGAASRLQLRQLWAAMDTFKDKQMFDDIYARTSSLAGLEPCGSSESDATDRYPGPVRS